jgi:hypothetical protein
VIERMTMDEACRRFRVSHPTVYRWQQVNHQGLTMVTIVTKGKDHRSKAKTRVLWDIDTTILPIAGAIDRLVARC